MTPRALPGSTAPWWIERFNLDEVGKGYALNFLLHRIDAMYPERPFDAYMVFDADNVLETDYIEQMNRTYSDGYEVITSYRNSKNFGDNWISSGYALWFMRESAWLNRPRMRLGTSCAISGTGFGFTRKVLDECGGWELFPAYGGHTVHRGQCCQRPQG